MRNLKIKIDAFYDLEASSDLFRENFDIIDDELFFFNDYGNYKVEDYYINAKVADARIENLRELYFDEIDEEEITDNEIIDEVIDYVENSFVKFEEDAELEEMLDCYGIEYEKNYYTIETRGYSQGDFATVIIPKKVYYDDIEEYISNLFWDAPIDLQGSISFNYTTGDGINKTFKDDEILRNFLKSCYELEFDEISIINYIKKYVDNRYTITKKEEEQLKQAIRDAIEDIEIQY